MGFLNATVFVPRWWAPTEERPGAYEYEIGQVWMHIHNQHCTANADRFTIKDGCTVVATVDSLIGKPWATLDVQPKPAIDWRPALGS